MKKLLAILLLAAPAALAQAPVTPQYFPDDYVASPCAQGAVCESFRQTEIAGAAAKVKGVHLEQDWVDKHWIEMQEVFKPLCRKAGTCFANPANYWVFCNDILQPEFLAACDRFPEGEDRRQCRMFAQSYYFGHDRTSARHSKATLKCAAKQPAAEARKLVVKLFPEKFDESYKGQFVVQTLDTATNVPVMARLTIEGQDLLRGIDTATGKPLSGYPAKWPVTYRRVPNADGHFDIAAPTLVVTAQGYEPVRLTMPVEIGKVTISTTPSLRDLKPGKNLVTVHAIDAKSGKPAELQVMSGVRNLGESNKPITIEVPKSGKVPEIWVTSLFDRYSDAVVR